MTTDLIDSTVEFDIQGVDLLIYGVDPLIDAIDFLIDTLDQLVNHVDVGTLVSHMALYLGLGHSGIIGIIELVSFRSVPRLTERSLTGWFVYGREQLSVGDVVTTAREAVRAGMPRRRTGGVALIGQHGSWRVLNTGCLCYWPAAERIR